jgi:hypothetical protein
MPERWQVRGLHLATLAGFAISQPVYDVLQRYPTFLVSHRLDPSDIVLLTVLLSVCIPASMFVLSWLSGLPGRRICNALHLAMFSVLLMVTLLPPVHKTSINGALAVFLAALATAAFSLTYVRSAVVSRYLGWCAIALVVFPGLFLANPSIRSLSFRGDGGEISSVHIAGDTPVVLLIFDEFPVASILDEDHHIDSARYPHFAALAEQSHWFRNASTVAAFTEQAVPAILTGTFPEGDKLPIHEDYPNSLFNLLGGSYAMHVQEAVTMLFPPALAQRDGEATDTQADGSLSAFLQDLRVVYLHILLPADFTGSLPSVSENWSGFNGGNMDEGSLVVGEELRERRADQLADLDTNARRSRVESVLDYIQNISADEPRTLHVLHSLLPHSAWEHTPSGRKYCSPCPPRPGLVENTWSDDDRYAHSGYQRHLTQVALADRLLGALVDQLEKTGLYDEALLVVTADHGASFWPGNPIRHLEDNEHPSDILDVPLFVKVPGQKNGELTDRHVRTIDIVPTITHVLGMDRPEGLDGNSILDPSYEPPPFKRARDSEGDFSDFDADADLKYDSVARMISLFGSGNEGSIYAVSDHHPLLGTDVSQIQVVADTPWSINTDRTYFRDNAELDTFTPAFIQGAIDGASAHESLSIVAVVNGTIEAVARSIQTEERRTRFYMVVPEESFGVGNVDLQLLVLDESGGRAKFMEGHTILVQFTQKALPPHYPSH